MPAVATDVAVVVGFATAASEVEAPP